MQPAADPRLNEFKRATEEKLRDVRCPKHRQRPRVCVIGASIGDAEVRLSGCCDKLMALANHAIATRARVHACGLSPTERTSEQPNLDVRSSR